MQESVIEMINATDTRLKQLEDLVEIIAEKINSNPGARDLAGLAKQHRETLREIEEIKEGQDDESEIDKILGSI
jgi:hypothetical protein